MKKSKPAALVLIISYFTMLIPLPWLSYFAFPNYSWVGLIVFWVWVIIMWGVSALVAVFSTKITLKEWYEEVFFSGVRSIALHALDITRSPLHWFTARFFEFWWCTCIKYIFPWAIYWLLIMTVQNDTENLYGEYYWGWQIIGAIVPVVGFLLFFIPLVSTKGVATTEWADAFDLKKLTRQARVNTKAQDNNTEQAAEMGKVQSK